MINQINKNENIQNPFSTTFRELQSGKLRRTANITKNCGVPVYEMFQFLLLLAFHGKNLFRFLLLLAVRVTSTFDKFARPKRVKVLVPDDSVIKRNRSKKVELLAMVYDHIKHIKLEKKKGNK
ncbi:MAG: hypothetical protein NC092_10805 [Butyrivibrio sp.]|nr:hypothetical protein [Muribaculum sp.]MCM1553170.1 hypothetical protein [Butyrivibrio sp.]